MIGIDELSKAANIGFGALAAIAFSRKWFVPGWLYELEKTRAEKYEGLYYELLNDVKRSAQRVQSATAKA